MCRGELDAQEPASSKGSAGAAERALNKFLKSLDRLKDSESGGLRPDAVQEFIQLMRGAKHREERAAVLELLGENPQRSAMTQFLRFRGLQFLRIFLADFAEAGDAGLQRMTVNVLMELPVGTKNVVDQVRHAGSSLILCARFT